MWIDMLNFMLLVSSAPATKKETSGKLNLTSEVALSNRCPVQISILLHSTSCYIVVTFVEDIPVHSNVNILRFRYRCFYSLCRIKGKDNGHTVSLSLGKVWVLVTDAFGAVEGGGGNAGSELSSSRLNFLGCLPSIRALMGRHS